MYVLQFRANRWDKWETMCTRYPTIETAKEALKGNPFQSLYRVAEEYTVIRYKAVRR